MKLFVAGVAAGLSVLAASCGGHSAGGDAVDTLSLTGEVIIPYDSLRNPHSIYTVGDRLYLINGNKNETYADEFATDGRKLGELLPKGQGPGELSFIYNMGFDQMRKQLQFVVGLGKMKVLEGMGTDSTRLIDNAVDFGWKSGENKDSLFAPGMQMFILADGTVVTSNSNRNGMFAAFTPDGKLKNLAGEYPPLSDFGDGMPEYMVYNFLQPRIGTNGDGSRFFSVIGSADMFETGVLDGDSIKVNTKYMAPPKGINVKVFDTYSSFEYGEDYMAYFGRLATSDNHAYVSYSGIPARDKASLETEMKAGEIPAVTELRVYDFDGNVRRVIRLDCVVVGWAVSADDSTLYAIGENDEDGFFVKRYDLN